MTRHNLYVSDDGILIGIVARPSFWRSCFADPNRRKLKAEISGALKEMNEKFFPIKNDKRG